MFPMYILHRPIYYNLNLLLLNKSLKSVFSQCKIGNGDPCMHQVCILYNIHRFMKIEGEKIGRSRHQNYFI